MQSSKPLLSTIHGSHLYGLAHEGSDLDIYEVHLGIRSRQTKNGDDDRLRISLEDFTANLEKGNPQAIEALCSPLAETDPRWSAFLSGLRPNRTAALQTYRRTALNFGLNHGGRSGAALNRAIAGMEFKMRRHALRLAHGMGQIARTGLLNPTLDEQTAQRITQEAALDAESYERLLRLRLDQALSAAR